MTPQISPLFTKEIIQKEYPAAEYKKEGRGINCSLHFMMALDQPVKNIIDYIRQLAKKNPPSPRLIFRDEKFHKFSPLHLAVVLGLPEVASALLISGGREALNLCDHNGWTPLHHAALKTDALYQTLIFHGADRTLLNFNRARAEHLFSLCHSTPPGRSEHPCVVEIEKGKLKRVGDLDGEELKTHLGIKEWRDTLFIPPDQALQLWKRPKFLDLANECGKYTNPSHFPPLKLLKTDGRFEVLAEDAISEETVIAELAGALHPKENYPKENFPESLLSWKHYCNQMEEINSADIGNIARFIPFGFPNVKFRNQIVYGVERLFVVALAPIKKGEPLFADYCIGHLVEAFGKNAHWQRDQCRTFFAGKFKEHLARYHDMLKNNKIDSKNMHHLLFPLNFPLALIDLHFSDTVPAVFWDQELCRINSQPFDNWQDKFSGGAQLVKCLIFHLRMFEEAFSDRPDLRRLVAKWVLDKVDKLSVLHTLKGIDLLIGFKSTVPKAFDQWDELERGLNRQLETYDPISDKEGPLSFDRRFEILCSWIEGPMQECLLQNIQLTLEKSAGQEKESTRMGRALLEHFKFQ